MKQTPIRLKQKLSPKAAAAKKRRDIAMAKTPARKAKKAENQRIGQRSDSDLHHTGSAVKRVSIKDNRGNFGKGTKNETKGSGFKMRSGNKTSFKMMGSSSPIKEIDYEANIAANIAARAPRRHDSLADAQEYISSGQANLDQLGIERTFRGKRQWRDAKGNWVGISSRTVGGKTTYHAPEWAKLESPIDVELASKQRENTLRAAGRNVPRTRRSYGFNPMSGNMGGGNYSMESQASGTGVQQEYMSAFTKKKKRK